MNKYGPEIAELFRQDQNKIEQLRRAAVVGAGVIGLSTALLSQEAGYNVTIYTDRHPLQTTSAKAAASFKPHEVVYNSLAHAMVESGWDDFARIVKNHDSSKTGVRKHVHWEAASSPKDENQAPYLSVVEDLETYERPNVPGGYAFGWKYKTFFIDTPVYLAWLTDKFRAQGGRLVLLENKLREEKQLGLLPADIIFNCTGLGAKELVKDDKLQPIKGQIAIIGPRSEMDWSISADGFYVYPRSRDTVLGGTAEHGVNNEIAENGAVQLILRGNKRILPDLSVDQVQSSYAGLRPYREGGIRIEAEEMNDKKIVHNYGHGGSGITMSWGSARTAMDLI